MSEALLAVVSAGIGAAGALGGVWVQALTQSRAQERSARERAYVDLLVSSLALARRAQALIATLEVRSGVNEGLAVTFGQRQEMDPMALHEWVETDLAVVMDAWTRVWAGGSTAGVRAGNQVMTCCGEVLGVLNYAAPSTLMGKLRERLAGVDTSALQDTYQGKLRELASARRELAELVRRETGRAPAALFEAHQ